jgi:DNA-binding MarR family transcriptional regulator
LSAVRHIDRAIRDAFVYLDALDRRALAGVTPPIMPSQYYALAALAAAPAQNLGELAARLLCDKGNASGLVDRLQAIGLVDRQRDPDDGRRVKLTVTPAGHDVLARATQVRAAALAQALRPLDADGLRTTEAHVNDLVALLRAAVNGREP